MTAVDHLAYFGLSDNPFRLTPDRDYFFPSRSHTAVAEVLRFGLEQGDGFLLVIGEVGTGKTMLLRTLGAELSKRYETVLLLSPLLAPRELVLAILSDLNLADGLETAGHDHLLHRLNDYLYGLATSGRRLAVIIDEAQSLPEESIEQLRLLSNFESDTQKLLHIVLVGQPELLEKIERPGLRQLLQRLTIMETLQPLSRREAAEYVHYRLQKAGRGDLRLGWPARRALYRLTGGVPRRINKLMARALLLAYARRRKFVDRATLGEAAASLETPGKTKGRSGPLPLLAALAGILLALVLLGAPPFAATMEKIVGQGLRLVAVALP